MKATCNTCKHAKLVVDENRNELALICLKEPITPDIAYIENMLGWPACGDYVEE